jgi:hypothetical protein
MSSSSEDAIDLQQPLHIMSSSPSFPFGMVNTGSISVPISSPLRLGGSVTLASSGYQPSSISYFPSQQMNTTMSMGGFRPMGGITMGMPQAVVCINPGNVISKFMPLTHDSCSTHECSGLAKAACKCLKCC